MNIFQQEKQRQKNEYAAVLAYFQKMNIESFFVPPLFQTKVRMMQPDLFGTRSCPFPLYDIESYVKEALTRPQGGYFLCGYDGHGVSSRAVHYYLVTDELALFVQRVYGSVCNNEELEQEECTRAFLIIEKLLESFKKLLVRGRKLVVVDSDMYAKGWGWVEGYPAVIEEKNWQTAPNVLSAVLDEVRRLISESPLAPKSSA